MSDRRLRPLATMACALALVAPAGAACPDKGGALVTDTKNGSGYHLHQLVGDLSFQIYIPGKSFQMDKARIPGHALFIVDGNEFQLERVPRTSFADFVRGEGEEQMLDAQMRYEQDYVRAMTPEVRFTDFGLRDLKASDGRHIGLVRLWKYSVPGQRASMYFLSTLLDKDSVAMVAANLTGSEEAAMGTLRGIAFSFKRLSAADCAKLPID